MEKADIFLLCYGFPAGIRARHRGRAPYTNQDWLMEESGSSGHRAKGRKADHALERAQELEQAGEHALALAIYGDLLAAGEEGALLRHGMGSVLHRLGDVDGAVLSLEAALAMEDFLPSSVGLATVIPGAPGADHNQILSARASLARRLLREGVPGEGPRPERWASGDRVLRVGFMSAFFHRSNYMKPVWGLLNQIPREEVQLHLFSDAPGGGEWTGYRVRMEDRIHTTLNLGNRELARLIRRQELDVLVDLNAYSLPGRLPILLHSLASVSVGWFNAFATYGLPGIDVVVGDREVVAEREEPFFAEEVRRLPQSYLSFTVSYPTPPVVPPPVTAGNPFTFGSLAPQYKITPPVLDLWATILRRAPQARLFLANPTLGSLHNRAWVLEQFVERGVATGRILFGRPGTHEAFLAQYSSVDVALDTFPYSGGVTTMEALWQGVPVLALKGDRWAGRTSRTILTFGDLGEWVLDNPESLLERAVTLVNDPASPGYLTSLRAGMRDRLSSSSVCDTREAARGFIDLLRRLVCRD